MNIRTFIVSQKLFWGYKCQVDLDKVNSLNEICEFVRQQLKKDLLSKNLIVLDEMLEGKHGETKVDFHIHDHQFGDILLSEPNQEFYVCSH